MYNIQYEDFIHNIDMCIKFGVQIGTKLAAFRYKLSLIKKFNKIFSVKAAELVSFMDVASFGIYLEKLWFHV